MNWLKKFGQIALKVGAAYLGFEPLAASLLGASAPQNKTVGTVVNDLTKIGQAVTTVETVFAAISDPTAKTGSQKLTAASALVSQIVQSSEMISGKKIKDEAAFTAAVQKITGGVADLLNSLEAPAATA
jgi:hypothetical protein